MVGTPTNRADLPPDREPGVLIPAICMVVALLLAVLVQSRGDYLTDRSLFYKWIAAVEVAGIDEAVGENASVEGVEEGGLYSRVVEKGQALANKGGFGDFAELTDAAPDRKWALLTSEEMDPLVSEFTSLLKKGEITSVALGGVKYKEVMGSGTSLTQMLLGFRNMAANLLWLKIDEFFHKGYINRMIPMIFTVVKLDPSFLEAYSLGAWHLAYNVPVALPDERKGETEVFIQQGVDLLKDGVKSNPHTYFLYFELGFSMYYVKIQDYEKAAIWLERAAEKHDRKDWVERMLYHAYERTGRFREANEGWTSYLERTPKDEVGERFKFRTAALMLESEGLYDRALEAWENFGLEFSSSASFGEQRVLGIEGIRLEAEGKYLEAFEFWERCFMQYPQMLDIAIENRKRLAEIVEEDRTEGVILRVSTDLLEVGSTLR